jgi:hypothetical protein
MLKKVLIALSTFSFAFAILLVSILRTAAVKYDFSKHTVPTKLTTLQTVDKVDYCLANPGTVLPDSPLWFIKAGRDQVWLTLTTNPSRQAELLLLFADKRLASSRSLIQRGNTQLGFSTLAKAENYLQRSYEKELTNRKTGLDTREFLQRLVLASLEHYEQIENLKLIVPDDVKPILIRTQDISKKIYEDSRNTLISKGITPPENPYRCN